MVAQGKRKEYMPRITTNKWIWISVYAVAVLTYLVLEVLDAAEMLRQYLVLPLGYLLCMLSWVVDIGFFFEWIDVGISGYWAKCYRLLVFSIELCLILLPSYYFTKTKKKLYLCILSIPILWIVLCIIFIYSLSQWSP